MRARPNGLRRSGGPGQDPRANGHADPADSTRKSRARELWWFRFVVADWLRDTRGLPTAAAHGIYVQLLVAQWHSPLGYLPGDPARLRDYVRVTDDEWQSGWPLIESLFPVRRGRRRNERLAALRREAEEARPKSSAAGKKAAEVRWRRERERQEREQRAAEDRS